MLTCNESWRSWISFLSRPLPRLVLHKKMLSCWKKRKWLQNENLNNSISTSLVYSELSNRRVCDCGTWNDVSLGQTISLLCIKYGKKENIWKRVKNITNWQSKKKNSIEYHNTRRKKRFLGLCFWFISAAWNLFNTRFCFM